MQIKIKRVYGHAEKDHEIRALVDRLFWKTAFAFPFYLRRATYVGANAEALEQAVATPIEQQINGVDNLNYMYSLNATANSQTTLLASRTRIAGGHFLFSFRCLVSPSIRFHGLDWCWPSAWSWMTPLSLSC